MTSPIAPRFMRFPSGNGEDIFVNPLHVVAIRALPYGSGPRTVVDMSDGTQYPSDMRAQELAALIGGAWPADDGNAIPKAPADGTTTFDVPL